MVRGLFACVVGALVIACSAAARSYSGLIVYADQEGSAGVQPRLRLAGEGGGYSATLATVRAGGLIYGPAWSPDGQRIAFSIDGLWVVSASDRELHQLTSARDAGAQWSPDGRWIAFARAENMETVVYLVRPDGSELHPASEPGRFAVLGWLDSRTLLLREDVVANFNSCAHLDRLRVGSAPKALASHGCVDEVAVSPDRRRLALRIDRRIAIERIDGSRFHWLTSGANIASDPVWSPSGKRIAFSREGPTTAAGGTAYGVMTIGLDGRGLQRVTWYVAHDEPLGWSPDGLILFERSDPVEDFGIGDLYVIRPDGSGRTKVAESASLGTASWRPR